MKTVLFITTRDKKEALEIGRVLVEEKLALCCNAWEGVDSVYWWNDEIEEASEGVLLVKTEVSLREQAEKRIKELHSYQEPSIIALAGIQHEHR